MTFTIEIAFALGVRDRIMGVDAEERRVTLSRFDGVLFLERSYWAGWLEADHYVGNIATWAHGGRDADWRLAA